MYLALVYYPRIEHEGFHTFRMKYEPFAALLPEHVSFIFPIPESIGREKLEDHISKVLDSWVPFRVHFCILEKTQDHWLFLVAKEGNSKVIELHDDLYKGILAPFLRKDLPFYPRIGLGLFSIEKYDFHNPTAELTLDTGRYSYARNDFEEMSFDVWCTIDQLSLLGINADLTECLELRKLMLN